MSNQPGADLAAMTDLCTPWCVRVVASLRIAEHMAGGSRKIEDIAAAASCNPNSLSKVLRHLVSRGMFDEPAPGEFRLNECARQLLDPAQHLALDLEGIGGRMANVWSGLLTAVRTGSSAYHTVFGLPFWQDLEAHPEIAGSHDELVGPAGHSFSDAESVLTGTRKSARTVVDVGGGTGATLAEILRVNPGIHGTLVDLPRTVARAHEVFEAAGVADRATTAGQSYFDPLPAGADLYLLKGILRLSPDRAAVRLLTRCAEAARPAGRVVIINDISPDDADGEYPDLRGAEVTSSLLLEMVVGGRSVKRRTVAEFRQIARQAGLEVSAAERHSPGSFIVECRPLPDGAEAGSPAPVPAARAPGAQR